MSHGMILLGFTGMFLDANTTDTRDGSQQTTLDGRVTKAGSRQQIRMSDATF
jgi:hypothetical protein